MDPVCLLGASSELSESRLHKAIENAYEYCEKKALDRLPPVSIASGVLKYSLSINLTHVLDWKQRARPTCKDSNCRRRTTAKFTRSVSPGKVG